MFSSLIGICLIFCGGSHAQILSSINDNLTKALLRGYMELDDGWVTPFNGYQYKATPNEQSWDESRTICRQWGSDLISYGFADLNIVASIHRGLALPRNTWCWIGLNDKAIEGTWFWVNGRQASAEDVSLWRDTQPNGFDVEDCGSSFFSDHHSSAFQARDNQCSLHRRAICEKLIT